MPFVEGVVSAAEKVAEVSVEAAEMLAEIAEETVESVPIAPDIELLQHKSLGALNESSMDFDKDLLKDLIEKSENADKDNSSIDGTDDIEKSEDESIKNCPIENGSWEGVRGNSQWTPNGEYTPKKHNPEGKTWDEILEEYGIDGIKFIEGEPDFKDISKGDVEIEGFSESRSDNYDKADIELAKQKGCSPEDVEKWRTKNKYTWHECKDMKTMQKVPSIVHGNISHRGGVSVAKGG